MKAQWNGQVIATSDDIVTVDGNAYFPLEALDPACIQPSAHTSVCGWKGTAHYYDVVAGGEVNPNAAWFYPEPKEAAQQIKGRVAFGKGCRWLNGVVAFPALTRSGGARCATAGRRSHTQR